MHLASPPLSQSPAVPPELLRVPAREETRRVDRWDCAHVLDPWLRRLARQDALARQVAGRLAAAFLRSKGHRLLGFARLGDYTRERLGLGAREMQELARVATRLSALPSLARAFETGRLSWAHVRLLTRVAEPEDAAAWVERAAGCTVRLLAAQLRAARRAADAGDAAGSDDSAAVANGPAAIATGAAAADPGPAAAATGPAAAATGPAAAASERNGELTADPLDDDTIDGEPPVRFRVACPQRVRAAWRHAIELARRMAGEEFVVWEAAEAIAAEGLAAGPAPDDVATPWPEQGWQGAGAATETPNAAQARWLPVTDAAPVDLEALAAGCESLDARALDARMRAALQAMARTDWQLGRLLRLFLDLRLERVFGFASWSAYVTERLGCSTRKARALVALERRGFTAPELLDAYRAGQLSWLRALTVLPVVSESTAPAWLERAQAVTLRRLADEVEWALAARDGLEPVAPPSLDADLAAVPRQVCSPGSWAPCDSDIAFVGPAAVVALLRTAIAAFARPSDVPWQGLERLLRHVTAEWTAQPRHPDPVFSRDGWRCAVPACTSRRNLHDHHLLFRSRGGGNTRDNRVTVCAWHHLHGIHGGRVRAWGHAPAGITWELGVAPGRPPLLRTCGDRYVEGRP